MIKVKLCSVMAVSLMFSGCSMISGELEEQDGVVLKKGTTGSNSYFQEAKSTLSADELLVVKNINHYVRGVMHDLVENLSEVSSQTPIGVTSFVFVDSDLQTTSLLGNQIAESFVHEIHQFGIPVVDYKMMDSLKITDHGDFVYSRDYTKLSSSVEIEYILTGTLAKHVGGYLLNARIIDIETKSIVSSAQGFVPEHVARAVLKHQSTNGINLTQG